MRRKTKNGKWKIKAFAVCILLFALSNACSIPNLDKPQCSASRETVKEFYSYHFGSDMKPSKENLQASGKFLTDELKSNLAAQPFTATDYFTATDDYPKAFRVGDCEVVDDNKTVFQIVFFWKTDTRNEQREVKVETIKQNDKWLINKVIN
jgi:hypothetical protein